MTAAFIVAPALAAVLGITFFFILRRGSYSDGAAIVTSIVSTVQSGLVLSALTGGSGLWFALAVAGIAASAIAFSTRQDDARLIVALGGSLGAVQLADPSGGIVAAMALPMLAGLQRGRISQAVGLLILLLFIPCLVAVGLAWLAAYRHINVAQWLGQLARTNLISWPIAGGHMSFASLLFFLPVLPVFVSGLSVKAAARQLWALFAVSLAVAAAALITMFLNIVRDPAVFMAALSPITPIALSLLPNAPDRERRALLASSASTIVSWLVVCGALIPAG